ANLEITDRQESIVGNCRENVVATLKKKLALHGQEARVIGSWDRNTLTRYLVEGDVDLMVILHHGKNQHWDTASGAAAALSAVKSILKDRYPNTEMVIDTNCVTMKLDQFKFDVVPAFANVAGYYTIPDTRRQAWIPTNPIKFQELVTQVNKVMSGDFVPLIKMMKGWNREQGWPIRGFHLECMMYHRYKSYTQSYTYNSMMKTLFDALPGYLLQPTYDPVTFDRVDGYLDSAGTRAAVVAKAKTAAAKAAEAYGDEEKYPSVAIREWKDLLGEFFPAYG
ncbi:MAG TPA: hypothetical protein VEO92_01155, partial [Candidatus Nitrosocosmicus sp.]|nr:hypothetical protein [Candidatus Nitrosocosmicus sp.]